MMVINKNKTLHVRESSLAEWLERSTRKWKIPRSTRASGSFSFPLAILFALSSSSHLTFPSFFPFSLHQLSSFSFHSMIRFPSQKQFTARLSAANSKLFCPLASNPCLLLSTPTPTCTIATTFPARFAFTSFLSS
jgi:hypothetical protein